MHKLPDFSAVIFDMDGLVLDTETTYCHAWKQAATEMGYEFSEQFCLSMSGLHSNDVERKLFERCGKEFDIAEFGRLSGQYWRKHVTQLGIPVKKGFFNVLDILKNHNIVYCLATNSRRTNALECLKLANITDVFSVIVSRDEVNQGKPAPEIFLLAADILNTPISKCLIVEDSATGITAAINAKAPSVFVPSVLPYDENSAKNADFLVTDLDELAEIILDSYVHPV